MRNLIFQNINSRTIGKIIKYFGAKMSNAIHSIEVTTNKGEKQTLAEYNGQVLLVVNTASACGFTPQYAGLEKLQQQFSEKGFQVLAFPCNQFGQQEKGDSAEIANFCDLQFNITFPLFEKIEVNGDNAHPLFQQLKSEAPGILGTQKIKWNFTKFLVGKNGKVIKRYAPTTKPEAIISDIEQALSA